MGEIEEIMVEYNVTEEKAKKILQQRQKSKAQLDVNVKVDPKIIEDAAGFRKIAEKLSKESQRLGLDVKSNEITPYNLTEHIEKMNESRFAQEGREQRKAEAAADLVDKGKGVGQATLSQQSGGSKLEFDSTEQMLDYLRQQSRSQNEDIAKESQAIMDEIFQKGLRGMREGRVRGSYQHKKDESPLKKLRKEHQLEALLKKAEKKKLEESD